MQGQNTEQGIDVKVIVIGMCIFLIIEVCSSLSDSYSSRPNSRGHFLPETATNYDHSEDPIHLPSVNTNLFSPKSRSKNTGSSAKGARSAKQYYKMDQMSIAASKVSTGAQFGGVEANFRTEEHFKGDVEAAELRP
ncbi:hypothetical protein EAE99_000416 [Botrytis elliptica]|nr:hypothetical protein EAE99_000416 [Botrytis elliptica]